ncbi:hypothetical protein MOQ_003918 [Trypanosoma cruzi marinkellei]|uniref:Uncharacterized protein n=1 Tax=Trypanosoma cruzi marinkellei TaxID=85056 RepID=K2MYT0_TRYCR|nr:hypothetical protein MOQ_003918 [Trypanosoma cruzi marinkellei]
MGLLWGGRGEVNIHTYSHIHTYIHTYIYWRGEHVYCKVLMVFSSGGGMLRFLRLRLRESKLPLKLSSGTRRRDVYSGHPSKSLLWLSRNRENVAHHISSSQETTCTTSPPLSKEPVVDGSSSSSFFSSPPLLLDPPFTPVPGESEALKQRTANSGEPLLLLYVCGNCKSPLFCSSAYAASSSLGRHNGGWPSFTAPVCTRVLQLRSLLQRCVLQDGGRTSSAVTLASSGLPVEGDMLRQTRSGRCVRRQYRTWREECIRDENKRSDPTVLEGCCTVCGKAICRVVTERRKGVKYVVNPTAVWVERAESSGSPNTAPTPHPS